MGYERYPRGTNPQGDYYNRSDIQDYGRDYGSGRDYSYSSARDYAAAGMEDRGGRDRDDRDRPRYGQRDYGNAGYAQTREHHRESSSRDHGRGGYGAGSYGGDRSGNESGGGRGYDDGRGGSYGRFRSGRDEGQQTSSYADRDRQDRGYGRSPQGYDYDDRGFFARAGDEVRSWFGDEEAERRREADMRYDGGTYSSRWSNDRDSDYSSWRSGQIAALDRDYDEYRREHRSKFENEFSSWRSSRQGQRDLLGKVEEHMDVVGSDGSHVGTVDKVRGDRILLTKNDADAGGRHHSIPSSWLQTVDGKVTLTKSADEAKKHWRDEERNAAMFGDDREERDRDSQGRMLNRSFAGTY